MDLNTEIRKGLDNPTKKLLGLWSFEAKMLLLVFSLRSPKSMFVGLHNVQTFQTSNLKIEEGEWWNFTIIFHNVPRYFVHDCNYFNIPLNLYCCCCISLIHANPEKTVNSWYECNIIGKTINNWPQRAEVASLTLGVWIREIKLIPTILQHCHTNKKQKAIKTKCHDFLP